MVGVFGTPPPKDSWTHADPVQVYMGKDTWQTVNETRCISHANLRQEIRGAFDQIATHFRMTNRAPQEALLQAVLRQDAPEAFYERPHAKMFAEYVIMQLCSSIGLEAALVAAAAGSVLAAETVLASNTVRIMGGGARRARTRGGGRTLLTPEIVATVLRNISLLRNGTAVEAFKQ